MTTPYNRVEQGVYWGLEYKGVYPWNRNKWILYKRCYTSLQLAEEAYSNILRDNKYCYIEIVDLRLIQLKRTI